jgi:Zn-dependent protease
MISRAPGCSSSRTPAERDVRAILRELLERTLFLIPLWISLGVHEWAHATAAHALGDDTAEKLGRMSLSPLAHLDPIGTVLLPLLGVPFGWAKPVPVEPTRFRAATTMRGGLLLVAAAGPLSNLALALVLFALDVVTWHVDPAWLGRAPRLARVLEFALTANVALAAFNLLPFAPLDGSRIVEGLVPFERRELWDRIARPIGILALVGFVIIGAPWLFEIVARIRLALRGG